MSAPEWVAGLLYSDSEAPKSDVPGRVSSKSAAVLSYHQYWYQMTVKWCQLLHLLIDIFLKFGMRVFRYGSLVSEFSKKCQKSVSLWLHTQPLNINNELTLGLKITQLKQLTEILNESQMNSQKHCSTVKGYTASNCLKGDNAIMSLWFFTNIMDTSNKTKTTALDYLVIQNQMVIILSRIRIKLRYMLFS